MAIKRTLAILATMVVAIALAACSAQGGASGGSGGENSGSKSDLSSNAPTEETDLSKDEILAELSKAMSTPYESVTLDGVLVTSVGGSYGDMQVPLLEKMDVSGDKTRVYMATSMSGMMAEIFMQGDEARAIVDGEETSVTPEELGMAGMSSPEQIVNSYGGGFLDYSDAVTDVSKEFDGDVAVYTVSVDAAKLAEKGGGQSAQLPGNSTSTPEDVQMVVRVDGEGRIVGFNISMLMSGAKMSLVTRWYDYGKTVVPYFPGSDEERNANTDSDAVYAMNTIVNYGSDFSGASFLVYLYDDASNLTEYLTLVNDGANNGVVFARYCSDYDENGWRTNQTTYRYDTGEERVSYTCDMQKDEQGRATTVKTKSSMDTESTIRYEYHANGALKSTITEGSSGAVSTEEYDEDGFHIRQSQESPQGSMEVRFTWDKSADGLPVGYDAEMTQNGQSVGKWSVDVKTDAAGNIIQSANRDTGKIISRAYWTKIENPNQYTKLFSEIKR